MKLKAFFLVSLLAISTIVEAFSKQDYTVFEANEPPCLICPVEVKSFQVVPGKIYIQYKGNRNFEGVEIKPTQRLLLFENGEFYVLELPATVVGANENNIEVEYDYEGDLGIGISINQFIIIEDNMIE